mmetsp:Transcript_27255/g.58196  ORF Transcript_27255/g.58196 Transcript_27255/m.58196 type:complete len:274 (-) Transcript_27255:626-1447(-)
MTRVVRIVFGIRWIFFGGGSADEAVSLWLPGRGCKRFFGNVDGLAVLSRLLSWLFISLVMPFSISADASTMAATSAPFMTVPLTAIISMTRSSLPTKLIKFTRHRPARSIIPLTPVWTYAPASTITPATISATIAMRPFMSVVSMGVSLSRMSVASVTIIVRVMTAVAAITSMSFTMSFAASTTSIFPALRIIPFPTCSSPPLAIVLSIIISTVVSTAVTPILVPLTAMTMFVFLVPIRSLLSAITIVFFVIIVVEIMAVPQMLRFPLFPMKP